MNTICLYTQNRRLSQRWEDVLRKNHKVRTFNEFSSLKDALGKGIYVVFHDEAEEEHLISELDALHESFAKKNTLVLRTVPTIEEGERLLSHDIGGYGNVNMSDDAFLQAIEVVCSGNIWLYPELMESVVKKINQVNHKSEIPEFLNVLTPRELEVALLVAKGERNQLIADDLKISQNTVKLHIASIFEKLAIKSRVDLAIRVNKRD